jgi:Putative Flp pilus-assembly TadE/G-like
MRSGVLRFNRDERGATAVVMAIVLVLLMGLTVLSVDGGQLFMQRRRMVRATDAGTLSVAQWCALNFATTQVDTPQARGLQTASNNVVTSSQVTVGPPDALNAAPDGFWWGSLGADPATSPTNSQCNSGQPSGKVVAKYDVGTDLLFAGMLNRRVSAHATGVWGAAGGGLGFGPFSMQYGRLTECDIYPPPPPEGPPPAEDCKFYFNDGDAFYSQSSWAPINLNYWDVDVDFEPCPATGGAFDMQRWIAGNAPALSLNYPDPTYVCVKHGVNNSTFISAECVDGVTEALACNLGDEMTFPVNSPCPNTIVDPVVGPLPHGQVDGPGTFVSPAGYAPCAGTPAGDAMKYDIVGFVTLQLVNIVRGNNKNAFQAACPEFVGGDYPDPSDANSYCLIARWVGYSTTGIEPGGGGEFGTIAVGLAG